jgi:ABC-type transport system involved in cytochrome c biogenesis permease component
MIMDIIHLAKKDILLEFRKRETLFSMGLFSFVSVLLFSSLFSFLDLDLVTKQAISVGCLWFIITFTIMLGLTSIFSRETRKNSIYPLLSLSIKPQVIFLAKLLYLGMMLAIIEIITLITAIVFLRIDLQGDFLLFLIVLIIGTIDLAIAGCIVAFLTLYAKSKTLAVPLLFFPLILPSVLIATQVTLKLILFDADLRFIMNNTLIIFLHAVIIFVLGLLVTDELISE